MSSAPTHVPWTGGRSCVDQSESELKFDFHSSDTVMMPRCFHRRENVIESQRRHIEEMEVEFEQLQVEMRSKEAEYEDRLQQVQQINKLRLAD